MTVALAGGNGLRLVVDVENGARIVSLTTADGVEWLAPSRPTTEGGPRPSFIHPGMGGWDEVVPTVQPDVLPGGTRVGDHGEAWSVPWAEEEVAPGHLRLWVALPSIHATLTRTIRSTTAGFRIEWSATTSAPVAVPLLWTAHPQFRSTAQSALSFSNLGTPVLPNLIEHHPVAGRYLVFDDRSFADWAPHGGSLKTFVEPGTPIDSVAIAGPGGSSVSLSWGAAQLPYLGLFWDNGEFAEGPVFSVEPTTGRGDLASEAMAHEEVAMLSPGRPLRWWIEITA
ncbi:hypothetical protein [Lacisediminihabitans changchengi]|uniref:Aldose 1-epimerase n=1 Tax=Lacisediminihabitans changchengi TaxID=2787634 RepID=A0A934SKN6_9MICO|nr:hypothetical protein [Lacisediminihabitans changchengi]MBK4347124.1 hypothetical protein [Lacisediminihabitans changchengi]